MCNDVDGGGVHSFADFDVVWLSVRIIFGRVLSQGRGINRGWCLSGWIRGRVGVADCGGGIEG